MNLEKIFKMQVELDNSIAKEHNLKDKNLDTERIIALIVEIAEFANEVKSFKYWKKDKSINSNKIMEEFVDGIHFFTSLSYRLKLNYEIDIIIISQNINEQYLALFYETSKLSIEFTKKQLKKSYGIYLGIAKLLNLKESDIIDAYVQKNKVNYERLSNGY